MNSEAFAMKPFGLSFSHVIYLNSFLSFPVNFVMLTGSYKSTINDKKTSIYHTMNA